MITHREYRRQKRKQARHLFSTQTKKKSLWIDRKTERHTRMIAALFFLGIGLIYGFGFNTLATWSTISRFYFGFAVITSFIPSKFYPILYRIRKEMKILFTLFAFSPMLTALVLVVNFSFISTPEIISYKVKNVKHYHNDYLFKVELENNEMQKFVQMRTFSSDDYKLYPDSAHYKIGKGIIGFDVVRKRWLTP